MHADRRKKERKGETYENIQDTNLLLNKRKIQQPYYDLEDLQNLIKASGSHFQKYLNSRQCFQNIPNS